MKFEENKSLNLMPQEVPMSPELLMVMNSLNNMGGIMATPPREETGLAALANMNYINRV
jgi:3-polyprenyl-4-hydroxybenzoate decarboxylase